MFYLKIKFVNKTNQTTKTLRPRRSTKDKRPKSADRNPFFKDKRRVPKACGKSPSSPKTSRPESWFDTSRIMIWNGMAFFQ